MEQSQPEGVRSKIRDIPSRVEDMAEDSGVKLNEAVAQLSGKARDYVRYADRRVQANPWSAVGVGFGLGLVMGALLTMAINAQRSMIDRLG
jgi:ElaB/YqjD/DUF883 family membrane-anchored ribosome-binding protein